MFAGARGFDIQAHWRRTTALTILLLPLAWLYCGVMVVRGRLYRRGWLKVYRAPVPVVVVGNLTVGGSGKTPLVCWLARFLGEYGYAPGVVSRGYGGRSQVWPQAVTAASDPAAVGDEPVLIAATAGVPVVVGPDRGAAVRRLLEQHQCNVIITDDGLQHLALGRDLEIVVIDGERRFGNGHCLPAGPLREPLRRLATVDLRVCNGTPQPGETGMRLAPGRFYRLDDPTIHAGADRFAGARVHAVAGIGNPQRFFHHLQSLGIKVVSHPFPDHHRFQAHEIRFDDDEPVIMTEKDAVKCRSFADARHWAMPVTAELDPEFGQQVSRFLRNL